MGGIIRKNFQEEVGKRGVKALESVYGTKYRFGTGADILCTLFTRDLITASK